MGGKRVWGLSGRIWRPTNWNDDFVTSVNDGKEKVAIANESIGDLENFASRLSIESSVSMSARSSSSKASIMVRSEE